MSEYQELLEMLNVDSHAKALEKIRTLTESAMVLDGASLSNLHTIITDDHAPPEMVSILKAQGIEVILV